MPPSGVHGPAPVLGRSHSIPSGPCRRLGRLVGGGRLCDAPHGRFVPHGQSDDPARTAGRRQLRCPGDDDGPQADHRRRPGRPGEPPLSFPPIARRGAVAVRRRPETNRATPSSHRRRGGQPQAGARHAAQSTPPDRALACRRVRPGSRRVRRRRGPGRRGAGRSRGQGGLRRAREALLALPPGRQAHRRTPAAGEELRQRPEARGDRQDAGPGGAGQSGRLQAVQPDRQQGDALRPLLRGRDGRAGGGGRRRQGAPGLDREPRRHQSRGLRDPSLRRQQGHRPGHRRRPGEDAGLIAWRARATSP